MRAQLFIVGVVDGVRCGANLHRKVEHGALARRDVGLAVIDGHLVGHQRILLVNAQDGAVRDHAIQALVGSGGGDDDHLALALGEAAAFPQHQRIVVREEGTALVGPMRQRKEDVRHKAALLLHLQDARADVFGNVGQ